MKNKKKDFTIIILPIILFIGIIALGSLRIKRGNSVCSEIDFLFIGFYIIWIIAESKISKKDFHTEGKENFDTGTCQIYAVGQGLTFLTALWFPSIWTQPSVILFSSFFIFIFGIIFRLWSIQTLGKYYSHKVCKVEEHKVVDSGPYRFIRHPAYAGMIFANLGIIIYFFNWVTLFVFLIVLLPAIIRRIYVEEKMLFEIDGYSNFAMTRKKLFPGVW
ncbi:MAG: isoprenylcysteine carboxylmethyltransferase family protein [Proteobacteria bacterium]|nr:isoprenylcysteine carboxylmethyltransferase family protein [Pseudomonadota bacterium]